MTHPAPHPAHSAPADAVRAATSASAPTAEQLLRLLGIHARLGDARSAVIMRIAAPGRVDAVALWHAHPLAASDDDAWLADAAELAAGATHASVHPGAGAPLAVVPLGIIGEPAAAAVFRLAPASDAELAQHLDRLCLGAVVLWAHRAASARVAVPALPAERLARAIELAAVVNRGSRLREVGAALVHELAGALRAERVLLGIVRPGARGWIRLEHISGIDRVKRSMGVVAPVEAAMEECAEQDQEIVVPEDAGATVISRAHHALSSHLQNAAVASLPIRTADPADPVAGVLTVQHAPGAAISLDEIAFVRLVLELVAPHIADTRARSGPLTARLDRAARRAFGRIIGPEHALAKIAAIILMLALLASVLVQRTEWIAAPVTILPHEARILAAPVEATLLSIAVEPGERVIAGATVLGRLDDSAVRLELAEVEARARALEQAEVAARGRGETADASIAAAQREEVEARIDLLRDRIERLTIIAPIDGVVIRAPERRTIGGLVRPGDALFEVADTLTLRFEAGVPVRWIGEVDNGTRGRLTLTGAPGDILEVAVARVEPVVRTTESGAPGDRFLATGTFRTPSPEVTVGMRGVIRLDVGRAPVLEIWTRSIADAVRAWGWW